MNSDLWERLDTDNYVNNVDRSFVIFKSYSEHSQT